MKKIAATFKKYRVLIATILGIGFLFLMWWLLSYLINSSLFPMPSVVFSRLGIMLQDSYTYLSIGWTLLRLTIAVVLGFIFGNIFGIIGGLSEDFYNFFRPVVVVLKTIPTATVIYLIIVLTRTAYGPLIIVFLIIFPLTYEAMVTGIRSINEEIIEALKVDGTHLLKAVFKVYIPLSWNYVVLGLMQGIGLGMKVCIMSEILSGDDFPGLGRMIYVYSTTVEMDNILAVSLIAIVLIGVVDIAIYFAKKKLKEKTNIAG